MGYGDVEDIDDVAEEDAPHTNSMPFNATTELSMLLAPFSTPVNPGFKQWLVVDVGTPVKPDT